MVGRSRTRKKGLREERRVEGMEEQQGFREVTGWRSVRVHDFRYPRYALAPTASDQVKYK